MPIRVEAACPVLIANKMNNINSRDTGILVHIDMVVIDRVAEFIDKEVVLNQNQGNTPNLIKDPCGITLAIIIIRKTVFL